MKLLIDIGNTRIKWALASSDGLLGSGALGYEELNTFLSSLEGNVEKVVLATVLKSENPEVSETLGAWCESKSISLEEVAVQKTCSGLTVAYDHLENLGVDRWLAMVAAWSKYQRACIIIDAGSAITVDYIDASGNQLGGLIVPGKDMLRRTLFDNTAAVKVPELEISQSWLPGIDTQPCVANGIAAMIRGLVFEVLNKLNSLDGMKSSVVLLSGGDAELISGALKDWNRSQLDQDHTLDTENAPQLVLQGLHYVS